MKSLAFASIAVGLCKVASADPTPVRCDDLSTADLSIDGLLDEWPRTVLARGGAAGGAVELRCSWDGTALAIALDIADDRVVRVRSGKADEDRVELSIDAGGKPVRLVAFPGNAVARPRRVAPPRVQLADSLQPRGFSIEARIPASAIAGFSPSTPSLAASIVFHDSDRATGGDSLDVPLDLSIELGDRKDLLDDFLRTVKLARRDIRLDAMAELDPDRRGKERIVAGGAVIGVLTDQFAFVRLPVARPADVRSVELLPLGARGQQVVAATVRQTGNGGSRDLLMLWTVWSGQLQPLGQIEIRKELGARVLAASWRLVKGKQATELWVEAQPATGFTAETWNELPAGDADPIVLPWDPAKVGTAYRLTGAELARRDLPASKRR
ncbi:MAG: hypothetical protein ACTHU0_15300 [Kofleriaceae bacterium]